MIDPQSQESSPMPNSDAENIQNRAYAPMPKNRFVLHFLILIVAFVLVGTGGFYVGTQVSKPEVVPSQAQEDSIGPTEFQSDDFGFMMSDMKKFLVSPNMVFAGERTLQSVMPELREDELIGLECSELFYYDAETRRFSSSIDGSERASELVAESEVIDVVLAKTQQKQIVHSNSFLQGILTCKTQDDREILQYNISPGGGGAGSSAFIGFIPTNIESIQLTEIPYETTAYFSCHTPVALTRTGLLYFICGGGDGGGGSSSLYEADLINAIARRLIRCDSYMESEESGMTTSCQN